METVEQVSRVCFRRTVIVNGSPVSSCTKQTNRANEIKYKPAARKSSSSMSF